MFTTLDDKMMEGVANTKITGVVLSETFVRSFESGALEMMKGVTSINLDNNYENGAVWGYSFTFTLLQAILSKLPKLQRLSLRNTNIKFQDRHVLPSYQEILGLSFNHFLNVPKTLVQIWFQQSLPNCVSS
jgi:hypothetical protein